MGAAITVLASILARHSQLGKTRNSPRMTGKGERLWVSLAWQRADHPYVFEDLRQFRRDACNRKGHIKNSLFDMETYEPVKEFCLAY
ncbi:MAG: hypothetical protein ACLP5H_22100 [Desulfomonilaceae bacterium]